MGSRVLNLIRADVYHHKQLHKEIANANSGMGAVLSLHRYGTKEKQVAA